MLSEEVKAWMYGLLAGAVGAIAQAFLNILTNPGTFDIFSVPGWKNIVSTATTSALVSIFLYLKQSPLPVKKVKRTRATKVVTTEETKDEDVTPKE